MATLSAATSLGSGSIRSSRRRGAGVAPQASLTPRRRLGNWVFVCFFFASVQIGLPRSHHPVFAQELAAFQNPAVAQDPQDRPAPVADVASPRIGWSVTVSLPLTADAVDDVIARLNGLLGLSGKASAEVANAPAAAEGRRTVVLNFDTSTADGASTGFEDALRLARTLARPEYRTLRLVAFVPGQLRGHAVLPVLGCDSLIVGPDATIGDATAAESGRDGDETTIAAYRAIASRRAVFPPAIAEALVRPSVELVQATTLDGNRRFVTGDELQTLRRDGGGWREDVWATAGEPLILPARRLQDARIASDLVQSLDAVRGSLDLAELRGIDDRMVQDRPIGVLLDVKGAISLERVRRWELNLINAADRGEINMVLLTLDSPGGNLGASVQLAGTLASTAPPLRQAAGYVAGRTLADASIIALACRPLYLHPDTVLGGPGGTTIRLAELDELQAAIDRIARDSSRPAALIRGLLDPELTIYRYTHRRTGEVRYATEQDVADDADADPDAWQQAEQLDLRQGLPAARAVELGLAEGLASSLEDAAIQVGLTEPPPPLADRGIVHFVEWLGSLSGVAIFLLLIGLLTLSVEASTPGLGVPGFVSLLCFAIYFWIQFLNGTAQWLEILAFALGVVCILIELVVLPGFGIFGIGGLCLVVIGLVLTSQTFVIPRNAYQYEQMTANLWLVIAAAAVVIAGLAALKVLLPQTQLMRDLTLDAPDDAVLEQSERLANFGHLLGQTGVATTPLMPAGRARFGDELVQVVSDGSPVSAGHPIRVMQVLGNRVVVVPDDQE